MLALKSKLRATLGAVIRVKPYLSKHSLLSIYHFLVISKGGNLATWRYGVSFSFDVLKPRCQVSVLVWFYGC